MRASVVEIQATRGIPKLGLGELWRFRDLIYFLAGRQSPVQADAVRGCLSHHPALCTHDRVHVRIRDHRERGDTTRSAQADLLLRGSRSLDPILNFIGIRIGKPRDERGCHSEDLLPPPHSSSLVCRIGPG